MEFVRENYHIVGNKCKEPSMLDYYRIVLLVIQAVRTKAILRSVDPYKLYELHC